MMRQVWRLFHKSREEKRLDAELRFHVERQVAEYVAAGMSVEDARQRVRNEFGGIEQVKVDTREARKAHFLEDLIQDIRYGARMLRRSPGFTAVAILTLGLGIGANIAVFTVVNTVLLHPLPYPDPDRIMNVLRQDGVGDSIPMFTHLEQGNPCFDDLAAYDAGATGVNLSGGDKPDVIRRIRVSRNYFRLFGANPIVGRTFDTEEDRPGGPRVLVLSYELWQRRFGGDPAVLGKTVTMGGGAYQIIGVISPAYKPQPDAEAWMPLQADPQSADQAHIFMVTGRLRSGVTPAQANTEIAVVGKRYAQTHPEQLGNDDHLKVEPMQRRITGDVKPVLLILLGAGGLVVLIACANVANLLLARATIRKKEIAVRAALGAGRGRIGRQLLTESLLLALTGGTLGLVFGSWGVRLLLSLAPEGLPRVGEMAAIPALDPRVSGFTALLSVTTAILFNFFPAIQLRRGDLIAPLKELGGRTGGWRKQNRTRSMLVAAEVAIAVVLLCGATLLMRSFAALHRVDSGIDARNVLTMNVSLEGPAYERATVVNSLARRISERLEQIPGVETAAMASGLPLEPTMDMVFDIPGKQPLKGFKFTGDVLWIFASPHYFETLRIPLISGRLPGDQEPPRTVVINEAMARRFWPNQDPIGQTILIGAQLGEALEQGPTKIVGVVGNVHDRLDWEPPPTMYQIQSQVSDAAMKLVNGQMPAAIVVRTTPVVPPMSVSRAVEQVLLSGDSELPATNVRTMEQVNLNSTARENFSLELLGLFAAIAMVLTAVGIYGVMAYSVEQRTREIGIRAALGAGRGDILKLVLLQASWLTCAGLAVGIAAAFGLTRLLSSELYGVTSSDPVTFAAVPLILGAVAIAAAWIPARRAMAVDPMVALRYE